MKIHADRSMRWIPKQSIQNNRTNYECRSETCTRESNWWKWPAYRYRNKIGRNETFLDEMKQVGHVMREGRSRGRRLIGSCTRAAWQLVSTREIVSRELDEMKQFWTKWNSSRSTRSQAGWFFRDQGRISVLLKCGNVRYTLNNAIISGGYYKVRFSAEIAKKCDLVRKLLKSAISHWPH